MGLCKNDLDLNKKIEKEEIKKDDENDYQKFVDHWKNTKERNHIYTHQNWKEKETVDDTYYCLFVDSLIRDEKWLYKVDYKSTKEDYYVLSCFEGPACQYKMKISVKEVSKELPEGHYLAMISENIFNSRVHSLTLFENDKPHSNHRPKEEIIKDFMKRKKGLSKFALLLIDKLELYLQKQVTRINTLKTYFGDSFDKHIPSTGSLSDACCHMKETKIGKLYDNTIGNFFDLSKKYAFEKVANNKELFILDINQNCEDFTIVFSCKHFLEHAKQQFESGQPSFVCIDATFNLVRGNFKLIVVGK